MRISYIEISEILNYRCKFIITIIISLQSVNCYVRHDSFDFIPTIYHAFRTPFYSGNKNHNSFLEIYLPRSSEIVYNEIGAKDKRIPWFFLNFLTIQDYGKQNYKTIRIVPVKSKNKNYEYKINQGKWTKEFIFYTVQGGCRYTFYIPPTKLRIYLSMSFPLRSEYGYPNKWKKVLINEILENNQKILISVDNNFENNLNYQIIDVSNQEKIHPIECIY